MIGCDFCETWYHGSCLNLKKKDIQKLVPLSWKCPKCDIPENPNENPTSEIYCFCQQPERHPMIGCDFCDTWYHGSCLNLKKDDIKKLVKIKWGCPKCDIPDRKKERSKVKTKKLQQSKCRKCAFTTNDLFLLKDHVENNHSLSSSTSVEKQTDLKWKCVIDTLTFINLLLSNF